MRDVIVAIFIFLLILAVSVMFYCLSMDFSKTISHNLQKTKEALKDRDFDTAAIYTSKCIDDLQKSNLWLSAMANHEELNAMKTGLLRLQQYIAYGEEGEAMAQLGEIIGLIYHFNSSEQINIENIF